MIIIKRLKSDTSESSATNKSTRTRVNLGTWRVGIVYFNDNKKDNIKESEPINIVETQ